MPWSVNPYCGWIYLPKIFLPFILSFPCQNLSHGFVLPPRVSPIHQSFTVWSWSFHLWDHYPIVSAQSHTQGDWMIYLPCFRNDMLLVPISTFFSIYFILFVGLIDFLSDLSNPVHPAKTLHSSVQSSHSVVYHSLRPHGLQHARPPCPSPTPRACSNSCPSSQ